MDGMGDKGTCSFIIIPSCGWIDFDMQFSTSAAKALLVTPLLQSVTKKHPKGIQIKTHSPKYVKIRGGGLTIWHHGWGVSQPRVPWISSATHHINIRGLPTLYHLPSFFCLRRHLLTPKKPPQRWVFPYPKNWRTYAGKEIGSFSPKVLGIHIPKTSGVYASL